jgi:hypothetical protein
MSLDEAVTYALGFVGAPPSDPGEPRTSSAVPS